MNLKSKLNYFFLYIFISLLSTPSLALDSDASQPVNVESDDAIRDGKLGLTTYRGNVVITQGSLKLKADAVHLTTKNGKLESVIATGGPVYLQQKPKPNEPFVKAYANKITYNVRSQSAQLKGNARLEQNGRELKSNVINYNFKNKFVEAKSISKDGSGRVHVTIPPADSNN